jgi:hypothetical protein
LIVEEQKCELEGTTPPCSGPICLVRGSDGKVSAVCQGHYEEVVKIKWR